MSQYSRGRSFSAFSILTVFILLCCIGGMLTPHLSVQLLPNRSYQSVSIYATMHGASPEVTDMELTTPIERSLARLKGIKNIRSTSGLGTSAIYLELDKWTDPERFRFEAASALRLLYPKLPSSTSYPNIYINRPVDDRHVGRDIIGYTLSGPGTKQNIVEIAENVIAPEITKIKEIYSISITGDKPVAVTINLKREKLRSAGLNSDDVVQTIRNSLSSRELGVLRTESETLTLSFDKHIHNLRDFYHFPIASNEGRIFFLNDFASIDMREVKSNSYYRINGEEFVFIHIAPHANTNTVSLSKEIESRMLALGKELRKKGYHLAVSYNHTKALKDELNKIYFRTILSVAILLLFVIFITRKPRYLLIVVLSLFANILISFIFYYLFKLEIHLYSLTGITISLGLIIDNTIVIVEDIRHTGRNRIFLAILASTLTAMGTLSVIFFLDEQSRLNLLDFAIAVIINLLVSLPIAYFFIPALLEKLPVTTQKHKKIGRNRLVVRANSLYRKQLIYMVRYRSTLFILFILCFGLPVFLLPYKIEKKSVWAKAYNSTFGNEFYIEQIRPIIEKYLGGTLNLYLRNIGQYVDRSSRSIDTSTQLNLNISLPIGSTMIQMDEVVTDFERYLDRFAEEVDTYTTNVLNSSQAYMNITFNDSYQRGFPYQLKESLERRAVMAGAADFSIQGIGQGFDNTIDLDNFNSSLQIRGYNYELLQAIGLEVREELLNFPRVQEVLISSNSWWRQDRYQEYILEITKPDFLVANRVSRSNIAAVLTQMQERNVNIGSILVDSSEFADVMVVNNSGKRPSVWTALNSPLSVIDSTIIRLDNVTDMNKVRLGNDIVRQNQEYVLYIHYRIVGSIQLNSIVQDQITTKISHTLPYGYYLGPTQGLNWLTSSQGNPALWLIALIPLIIYIICAALLESLSQPLTVIAMVPFSFMGVFLIFHFLRLNFDQGGYASLLLVSGLVTNAALYIINDYNFFLKNRNHTQEQDRKIRAFVRAFNAKAMPILVTTFSAMLSLVPFVVNGDEKGFWFTLSVGTIGGLFFSLLGAYLLLPICLLRQPMNDDDNKKYLKCKSHD